MGTFRNWPATLRKASYRGAPFYVENDKHETGRRLVVHEFPHRDEPYVEDLGRSANKMDVTAYVVGDSADSAAKRLLSACDAGGAATLNLPIATFKAHCEKCSRDFTKDKLGYIAFSISFVRDGSGAAPYPVAYLARLIETSADGIASLLSSFFSRSFATIDYAGYVAREASDEVGSMAAQLDMTFRSVPLDIAKTPALLQMVSDLSADADTLVAAGDRADKYGATSFVMQQAENSPAEIVTRLQDIFSALVDAAEPDVLLEAATPLADFVPVDTIGQTPSAKQSATNIAALRLALRISALTAIANAIVNRTYSDRRQGTQARADAAELFNAELDRLSGAADYELFVAIKELSGRIATYLSRLINDLAPVVSVSAPSTMPALWWSQRLYGNADRASELVARNSVVNPAFMPTEFEALAS